MKFRVLYLLAILGLMHFSASAQRGVRIGYIDTEYILQNVPEYQEAASQLDNKIANWKSEIEKRLSEVEQKKAALENEKVLLTKELYDERFEDISYEEAEIIDYQQKRFGPNGDMVIQRSQLIQPIQDQIFSAVQEIAENKKFDFVFDKSADVVMLYSAERYDISQQVLRTITRASNRQQAESRQERRALEEEDIVPEVSEEKDERAQALDDRKAQRAKELEDKRAEREKALEERRQQQDSIREAKKAEAEARRQKVLDARKDRESKEDSTKTETSEKQTKIDSTKSKAAVKKDSTDSNKPKTRAELLKEKREQAAKDRAARVKALEDRKKKIAEERKKAREEREAQVKKNDSIKKAKESKEGENNN